MLRHSSNDLLFSCLRRSNALLLTGLVGMVLSSSVSGQVTPVSGGEVSAPSTKPALVNSLGMPFREVPGTPVLFCIWETRVRDFAIFLQRSKYEWSFRPYFTQTEDHPVVNTTLRDAVAFCNWLTQTERGSGLINDSQTYRLPRKDEWDAAVGVSIARLKGDVTLALKMRDQQSFPWGTEWPPPSGVGNFNSMEINGTEDHYSFTAPVGKFAPSQDGLFDLAGNVWEWTWEQEVRPDASLRGGSWMYFRKECLLSSYEYRVPADTRAPSIGFRVVLEDRRRNAVFLAEQKKAQEESEKGGREKLTSKTKVTDAEVAKMRESLGSRNEAGGTAITLPNPATLKQVQKAQPFINTLGMSLQPLGENPSLIGAHEVRVQDYEAFLTATGSSWGKRPSFEIKPSHPVVNVTWQQARDFCKWLTEKDLAAKIIGVDDRYRLPSDEEWSLAVGLSLEEGDTPAAKHLKNRVDFPWGRELVPPLRSTNIDTSRLSYQDDFSYTAPVGTFSPNALRLYDMAGNAAEWCEDAWPGAPDERVVRGSSWMTIAPTDQQSLLSSNRQHVAATTMRPDLGFRVILQLQEPKPK